MALTQIVPELYSYIFFSLIFVVILFYFLFMYHKEKTFNDFITYFKISIICFIFCLIMIIFANQVIVIFITSGKEAGNESWIFMLLNTLLFGIYINVLGLRTKNKKAAVKYLLLGVLIVVSITGFGYLGFRIEFRKPIIDIFGFNYYILQTNTPDGIYFFTFNLLFFALIYFLSFITEKEN